MVKGRRKSRSKSSGDFCSNDCDDADNDGTTWRRMSITGEVLLNRYIQLEYKTFFDFHHVFDNSDYIESWTEIIIQFFKLR